MPALKFIFGKEVQWDDLSLYISGVFCSKFQGIKFRVNNDKGEGMGQGNNPYSIQSGNKTREGSMTLSKSAYDSLFDAAIAAGGEDITDLQFDITIKYRAKGKDRGLRIVNLVGCEITQFEEGMMQGDKEMKIDLPFKFLRLVRA